MAATTPAAKEETLKQAPPIASHCRKHRPLRTSPLVSQNGAKQLGAAGLGNPSHICHTSQGYNFVGSQNRAVPSACCGTATSQETCMSQAALVHLRDRGPG